METGAVYDKARKRLAAVLAMMGRSQNSLARDMGQSPSTLVAKLARDDVAVWEEIAEHFPPALWIVAQLHSELAVMYHDHHQTQALAYEARYDMEAKEAIANVRKSVEELGLLLADKD